MKASQVKKLLLKITSGIFAITMVFSAAFANFSAPATQVDTAAADTTPVTTTETDVETTLLNDGGGTSISSDNWVADSGVYAVTRSDNMRFNFEEQEYMVSNIQMDPWNWGKNIGNTYGGALVVEWDSWLNNVEAANFGFIYGQETQNLRMESSKANCLSFYGLNSIFYGTLENDSSVIMVDYENGGVGKYPPANRWIPWERSAKNTLYIHANGRQELYQNDKLIAYVTLPDITTMRWKSDDPTAFAENTFNTLNNYALEGNNPLKGYCGFAYRPTTDSGKNLDLTLSSLRVGWIGEDWFYNNGYRELNAFDFDGVNGLDQGDIYRTGQPTSNDNPFPTDASGNNSNIKWEIDARTSGGTNGMTNTGFTMMNRWGTNINNVKNVHTRSLPGWVTVAANNYGFYTNPLLNGKEAAREAYLKTTAVLSDVDYRMGGQRYAMIDIQTWLAGLGNGTFSVTMGQLQVEIRQATEPQGSDPSRNEEGDQLTSYYIYVKDGDTYLKDITTHEIFVPIKIYDNALLRISLWGDTAISVSYGRDELVSPDSDARKWITSDFAASYTSGKTAGPVLIKMASNSGRCLLDDIKMYSFSPAVESFDDEDFAGWTQADDGAIVSGGMISFSSRAIFATEEEYTNFVMEFDVPKRSAEWIGITFGMESQNQAYTNSDLYFLYFGDTGTVNFSRGGQYNSDRLIEGVTDKSYAPVLLPTNIGTPEQPKYPTAHMYWDQARTDAYAAENGFDDRIGMVDKNLHVKIVVLNNVLTVYTQFDGYETTMTFKSVNLAATGSTKGYVAIQSITESRFSIDNLSIMAASNLGAKAVNTFLNTDGSLFDIIYSEYSTSNAMDTLGSAILPSVDPSLDGYTFIGWIDSVSGDLISDGMTITNHGGRVMYPFYVAAYGNSMTTGGNIQVNFYLEYKSVLTDRGNRVVMQIDELDESGSVVESQVQVSTDADIKEAHFTSAITGQLIKTYKFYYSQDPKDYNHQLRARVRVGGVDFFAPRSLYTEEPWADYSLDTYLLDVAFRAETLAGSGEAAAAKAYAEYATGMRIFCESARQYFDDNMTDLTYASITNVRTYQYWTDTMKADLQAAWNNVQSKTSADFASYKIGFTAHQNCVVDGAFKYPTGFKYKGFTSVFELGTELRYTFQFEDGNGWFYYTQPDNIKFYWGTGVGGTEVRAVRRANNGISGAPFFYIPISNIAAKDLATNHLLTVSNTDTGEWFTIRISVLGYAQAAIQTAEKLGANAVSEDIKLAGFCKALLLYQQTANAYAVYQSENS